MEFSRQEYWNGLPFSTPLYLGYDLNFYIKREEIKYVLPKTFSKKEYKIKKHNLILGKLHSY